MKKTLLSLIALAMLVVVAAPAEAQWNAVATTGVIRPGGAPYAWVGPRLEFAGAAVGQIVARYPVTNTYGSAISNNPPWNTLRAAIDDNSASATVRVRIVEVPHCGNQERTLCGFGSVDVAGTQCPICIIPAGLNFAANAYYVEVVMDRTANVPVSVTSVEVF